MVIGGYSHFVWISSALASGRPGLLILGTQVRALTLTFNNFRNPGPGPHSHVC